jgi:hypothetical protein
MKSGSVCSASLASRGAARHPGTPLADRGIMAMWLMPAHPRWPQPTGAGTRAGQGRSAEDRGAASLLTTSSTSACRRGQPRRAYPPPPGARLASPGHRDELPDGKPVRKVVGELPVVAVRAGGQVHVLADRCSHMSGPLSDGQLADGCLTCPLARQHLPASRRIGNPRPRHRTTTCLPHPHSRWGRCWDCAVRHGDGG